MRKVKGTMFIPWVKAIKADKTGLCDDHLTQGEKEVMSGLILPSSWYSFETYKNCLNAVSMVFAQNNPGTLWEWGKEYGKSIMSSVYKRAIQEEDPKLAMEQFVFVFKSMFNFGRLSFEIVSDNEMLVSIEEFDPDFEVWYYVTIGWLEQFIELCLKKTVQAEFGQKSWEGAPMTQIKVTWDA
ncbi:MAG TPA: hypothetical protein HPQ03_18070 [Deltaproteobacteria bacterium]|nr:hypothetical protein [Deltaproteobacteria bacterium]